MSAGRDALHIYHTEVEEKSGVDVSWTRIKLCSWRKGKETKETGSVRISSPGRLELYIGYTESRGHEGNNLPYQRQKKAITRTGGSVSWVWCSQLFAVEGSVATVAINCQLPVDELDTVGNRMMLAQEAQCPPPKNATTRHFRTVNS